MGVIVDIGYQLATIFFYSVVLLRVNSIGDWSYHEVMLFTGISIIFMQFYFALLWVFNIQDLPSKIKNADVDLLFLKPINSMFYLTLSKQYISGFFSMLSGVFLIIYSLINLNLHFNIVNILSFIVMFIFGLIICYSLTVIITSFSFKYSNTNALSYLASSITGLNSTKPHIIYEGIFKKVFFYVIPVSFMSSIPSSFLFKGFNASLFFQSSIITLVTFLLSVLFWNYNVKSYTSAG